MYNRGSRSEEEASPSVRRLEARLQRSAAFKKINNPSARDLTNAKIVVPFGENERGWVQGRRGKGKEKPIKEK